MRMEIGFYKYQGAGNDFIILDNRSGEYDNLQVPQVHLLCDRRFGVGADGLMMLNQHPEQSFEMKYFNADGKEGSLCGNGGRCIVAFAHKLGLIDKKAVFEAVDGPHEALLIRKDWVELKMNDVTEVERGYDFAVLNTGSPHYVKYADQVEELDVVSQGKAIRNNDRFATDGINVNFVEYGAEALLIRTYERGVEDETLACGTGITAAAIVVGGNQNRAYSIPVKARGGELLVRYEKLNDQHFTNIWLCGPATFVYEGKINLAV